MSSTNFMEIYLMGFESEKQIRKEIAKMEKLRKYLNSEINIINQLKYVSKETYDEGWRRYFMQKYEISPAMFERGGLFYNYAPGEPYQSYLTDIYKSQILSKVKSGLIPEFNLDDDADRLKNVKETIYKVAYHRIKREKKLVKLLTENNLDVNKYENAIEEVSNRIAQLYKKACDILCVC